jgi:hypothetical protein
VISRSLGYRSAVATHNATRLPTSRARLSDEAPVAGALKVTTATNAVVTTARSVSARLRNRSASAKGKS